MRKILFSIIFIFMKLTFAEDYLSAFGAFHVDVLPLNKNAINVQFKIAPDYHIYQNKIKIKSLNNSSVKIGDPIWPDTHTLKSPDIGTFQVYDNNVIIQVPIRQYGNGKLKIQINYQGCKGLSICYPEEQTIRELDLDAPNTTTNTILKQEQISNSEFANDNAATQKNIFGLMDSITNGNTETPIFKNNSWLTVFGFFLIGLMLAFTPCVFPLLPILIGIISGAHVSPKRSFFLALSYISGGALVYAICGVIAASLGYSLSGVLQSAWLTIIISVLFAILALSLFGVFQLQIPNSLQNKLNHTINKFSGGSIISAFIIGGIANLVLSPCVTAPLAGALIYISTTGNQLLGGSALFAMGFGSGLPLLLIAILGKRILPKSGAWMLLVKKILALMMLLMAIYMLSKLLDNWEIIILLLIWVLFTVFILIHHFIERRKNQIIIGLISLGIVTIFATGLLKQILGTYIDQPQFIKVNNITQLEELINSARTKKQPILIDYYASWCIACKEMGIKTFIDPQVARLMKNYTLIQADITNNDLKSQELQKRYQVIAPPSIVFLDSNGNFLKKNKITGFVGPEELSQDLQTIMNNKLPDKLKCKDKIC